MTEAQPKRKSRKEEILPGKMNWKILENILRNYYEFKALYEETGIYEITLDNGYVVNFHDILKGLDSLPPRQKQAVWLMCIEGRKEVEVAKIMGFERWSAPVGMYKRKALRTLVETRWKDEG
jgi:DNA-directed RNA polymerase specialized sigma24 family protein